MPPGARVQAFGVVSDEERDALDRAVAELSSMHDDEENEEHEQEDALDFGEPGWYDVARETSG